MSTVPNAFASTSIFKGDITTQDFLHLVRESDGSILGWLDENGIPQGSMAIGGGGGGSSVFVNGTPVNNPNFLAGPGVAYQILGSNVTLSNTGVLSLNSQTGALSAVLSLNSLVGNLNITAGAGIGITPSGASVQVINTGVTNINALTGAPSITAGSGIAISVFGSSIQVTNSSSAASLPWFDVQAYGGQPRLFSISTETTTATSVGGTPNLALAAAKHFTNGQYVVGWKMGNATAQSTPTAPAVVATCVTGSQSISYQCVGVDSLGGLTAASPVTTITNAPAIFGNLAVPISSITAASGVVTATFSSPINAVAGQTIHITHVSGSGVTWNGVWTVVTAPTTSSVTYAVSGATGTGTVGASTQGRLSNVAVITAITRSASGVITITTAEPHNYVATPSTKNAAVVIVENCSPPDLNGQYVMATASGTTITCNTGQWISTSGTVTAGLSTATSYEYIYVTCPAYSGTTAAYYIYSNSPNPSSTLTLVGKTMPGERGWKDGGPTLMQGFVAQGYVPTVPPVSSQNQMFGSQIVSGGGTTSLVLANNVPASVTNGTLMHDDGQAITAAFTALHATSLAFGTVFMTTPQGASPQFPRYIINYPTTVPAGDSLIMGCFTYINETLEFLGGNAFWASPLGYLGSSNPAFGTSPYIPVTGNASPLVWINGNAVTVQNIFFSPGGGLTDNPNDHNGQYGLIIQAEKVVCRDCFFGAGISSSAIPCILNSPVGGMDEIRFEDCQWQGSSVFGVSALNTGQSPLLPGWLPNLWIHGSDNTGGIGNSGQISIQGACSFQGRGILVDGLNYSNSTEGIYNFGVGGTIEYQAPCTPSAMFWGQFFDTIIMANWTNDTGQGNIVANWTNTFVFNVQVENCITSGNANFATGLAFKLIEFKGNLSPTVTSDLILGQNINRVARTTGAILVTSGSTSDVMVIGGIYAGSIPQISAGNASAAADMAAGNVSWSALGANTITINHGSTSGMIFSVSATGGF